VAFDSSINASAGARSGILYRLSTGCKALHALVKIGFLQAYLDGGYLFNFIQKNI